MKIHIGRYSLKAGILGMILFIFVVFFLIPVMCHTIDSWLSISGLLVKMELFGILFLSVGLVLVLWCTILFFTVGQGTPAHIYTPKKLVVKGPYKYVRNPMMTGAFFILLGESLIWHSLSLLIFIFFAAWPVSSYMIRLEEKYLEETFGDSYLEYKMKVPKWLPKLRIRR